ncbi:MAG: GMP synthase [Nitrospiria bacterium]
MNIGILEADHLSEGVRERFGTYSEMFQRLLRSVYNQFVFQTYPVIDCEYPDSLDSCDAYLITGSKASAYEDLLWIKGLQDYVITLDAHKKKLIGICFGHQIIAQALGGKVQKSGKGWGVGAASVSVFKHEPWIDTPDDHFQLLVSHQDQVIQLPPKAERIAGNDFCPNASYQIGEHILTFQGHPEFSPDYLKYLIEGRRESIGTPQAEKALDSLQQKTDHLRIARWIVAFLKQS